jgi:hypothetical protein
MAKPDQVMHVFIERRWWLRPAMWVMAIGVICGSQMLCEAAGALVRMACVVRPAGK